jgi:hypothetical protein
MYTCIQGLIGHVTRHLAKFISRLKIVTILNTHSADQRAAVTIIGYKPLSDLNFARYTGHYGSYMPSQSPPLGVYKPLIPYTVLGKRHRPLDCSTWALAYPGVGTSPEHYHSNGTYTKRMHRYIQVHTHTENTQIEIVAMRNTH